MESSSNLDVDPTFVLGRLPNLCVGDLSCLREGKQQAASGGSVRVLYPPGLFGRLLVSSPGAEPVSGGRSWGGIRTPSTERIKLTRLECLSCRG